MQRGAALCNATADYLDYTPRLREIMQQEKKKRKAKKREQQTADRRSCRDDQLGLCGTGATALSYEGCDQTAAEADSNQIPSKILTFRAVYTVASKRPDGMRQCAVAMSI